MNERLLLHWKRKIKMLNNQRYKKFLEHYVWNCLHVQQEEFEGGGKGENERTLWFDYFHL